MVQTIDSRIKVLRETAGLTQSELAKKLGITRSSVNAWEMGLSVPSTQYIVELAELFHVSADYLLGISKTATINIEGLNDEQASVISHIVALFKSNGKI